MKDTRHVNVVFTVDEAIAINNHTMELLEAKETPDKAALRRAAKKLLKALNDADPIAT